MAAIDTVDYYDILGVDATATDTELRKAWRRKAVELHPDKHAGSDSTKYSQLFDAAKQAFELLSDSKQRAEYDAKLRAIEQQKKQAAERVKRYKTDAIHIQRMRSELQRQEAEYDGQLKQQQYNAENIRRQNRDFIDKLKAERQHYATAHNNYTHTNTPYAHHTSDITSVLVSWDKALPAAKLYTENYIRTAFSIYGIILQITINSKRGRCIVDYRHRSSAVSALKIVTIDKHLTVKLLDDTTTLDNEQTDNNSGRASPQTNSTGAGSSAATAIEIDNAQPTAAQPRTGDHLSSADFATLDEYEAYTKQRLKQKLAERKAMQQAAQHSAATAEQPVHNTEHIAESTPHQNGATHTPEVIEVG